MAFDGIVTKMVSNELNQLSGGRIDKIFQPNKNNILLGFYLNGCNYLLNISIDSQNYRVNLTTNTKPNPKTALNFCMVLRKHLLGLRIKSVTTSNLERVITICFEGFDDIDDLISKKLVIELMGKHGNILLLDDQNIIIDSSRHIYSDDFDSRNLIPKTRYLLPKTDKLNFLEILDFSEFNTIINNYLIENQKEIQSYLDYSSTIPLIFNGISKSFIESLLNNILKNNKDKVLSFEDFLSKLFTSINDIVNTSNYENLIFLDFTVVNKNKEILDYALSLDYDNKYPSNELSCFKLNFFLDDFYFKKESNILFNNKKEQILSIVNTTIKKYEKRLININSKLEETKNMDTYRIYGELITSNLYKLPNNNVSEIIVNNYYDNNNELTIKLDKKYNPSINAKRFFKKYSKLKNTLNIVSVQKIDTLNELHYLSSINYEVSVAENIDALNDILDEISTTELFKSLSKKQDNINNNKSIKKKNNSNKNSKNSKLNGKTNNNSLNISFNPIKYVLDNNFTLLVGRNNKENDYLTLKYAKKTDMWFHTKDIHGSHCILKSNNSGTPISNYILEKCSSIAAYHSKGIHSSKVLVDFCEVKFVKKPTNSRPGMVIYTNNQTLYVCPSNKV